MDDVAMRAFEDRERSQITHNIRTHRVHLTYVSADPDAECDCCRELGGAAPDVGDQVAEALGMTEDLPPRLDVPFCYTTGLHGVGHPELVVLGLPPETSAALLNTAAHQVTDHRLDLVPGRLVPQMTPDVLVEEIPNPGMVVFQANNYYRRPWGDSVPAYQLTWADPTGRFPWDEGHVGGAWSQPRPGSYRA